MGHTISGYRATARGQINAEISVGDIVKCYDSGRCIIGEVFEIDVDAWGKWANIGGRWVPHPRNVELLTFNTTQQYA